LKNSTKRSRRLSPQQSERGSTSTLPYGLRELAPPSEVFWGTLTMTPDRILLRAAHHRDVLDVCFSGQIDDRLNDRNVSILGHLSQYSLAAERAGASITAQKVVSHEAVSLRAYEIAQSGQGGSPVENWLRAERELLHH
jgi:hypothetical protein